MSATDGSPALGPGGSRCTPVRDRTVPPLPAAEWVSGPPSFGPLALSGQQQDAGRVGGVLVASEVATNTRHGRRFYAKSCPAVPVLLGTGTARQLLFVDLDRLCRDQYVDAVQDPVEAEGYVGLVDLVGVLLAGHQPGQDRVSEFVQPGLQEP